jgi:hypothetical protein
MNGLSPARSRDSVLAHLDIRRAYELSTGVSTACAKRIGRHITVQCAARAHVDAHASCDLDVEKNAWVCRSCSASGGVLDLAVAAGHAPDRAGAAKWFETRLGVTRVSTVTPLRSAKRRPTPCEVEAAVKCELERLLDSEAEVLGCRPPQLTRHLAEARRVVGRRLGLTITSPPPRWWELEPHAADPLWRFLVVRAIEERAWRCGVAPDFVRRSASANPRVADAVLAVAAHELHRIGAP